MPIKLPKAQRGLASHSKIKQDAHKKRMQEAVSPLHSHEKSYEIAGQAALSALAPLG